jgi:hypothetical protein
VRLKDLEEYEQQSAGGDVSASASRSEISRLSGEREQVEALNLQLKQRRIQRDLDRFDAEEREAERKRAEAEAAEEARSQVALQQARLQFEAREQQEEEEWARQAEFEHWQQWADSWLQYGLRSLASYAPSLPGGFVLQIQPAIEEALRTVSPTTPPAIVQQLVLAAIQQVIAPRKREQEIEKAIKLATKELPIQVRNFSHISPPTEWEARPMHLWRLDV